MPKDFSFLEEASKVVVGKTGNFRIQWNSVSLGDNDVIVERPAMTLEQLQSRRSEYYYTCTPIYMFVHMIWFRLSLDFFEFR